MYIYKYIYIYIYIHTHIFIYKLTKVTSPFSGTLLQPVPILLMPFLLLC